jgi:hypothetical protein
VIYEYYIYITYRDATFWEGGGIRGVNDENKLTDKTMGEARYGLSSYCFVMLMYLEKREWSVFIAIMWACIQWDMYGNYSDMCRGRWWLDGEFNMSRGSVVVKTLCYKPEGRGFDIR